MQHIGLLKTAAVRRYGLSDDPGKLQELLRPSTKRSCASRERLVALNIAANLAALSKSISNKMAEHTEPADHAEVSAR